MKKALLITMFSACIQFSIFGYSSYPNSLTNDSLKWEISEPSLQMKGARVYNGNVLLAKSEVLNILRSHPDLAKKYEKGKNLRNAGGLLIAGSVVTMTGGIILMVKGIENNYDYYYDLNLGYNDNYYAGMAVFVIGELMLDGGIASSIIGKLQIRRSVNRYNAARNSAIYTPGTVDYKIGLLDNGRFGVRLRW